MMKKINKESIWLTILITVFLLLVLLTSTQVGNQHPAYSVLNKSEQGYSIFYELLKKHNYPVNRTEQPVTAQQPDNIQLITTPYFGSDLKEKPKLKDWVEEGGTLVLLLPRSNQFVSQADFLPEEDLNLEVEEQGKGSIITVNRSIITNSHLLTATDGAYKLLTELEKYNYQQIYFNEHNLFAAKNNQTLWDIIPLGIKVVLYQFAIVLVAFLYYHGKRFGKPKPLQTEVEREENEYVYSAASLYHQAECWDLIVNYYYDDFLNRLGCTHDSWLQYWQRKDLPSVKKAKRIHKFMDNLEENPKEKNCVQIITNLEALKEIINKRRDKYWKSLKKNM